jgi:hypothetical protein
MPDDYIKYGFVSFYYIKDNAQFEMIMSKCQHVLIDSGAFSFQRGQKGNLDDYLRSYARFAKRYTNHPKVEGFFELDIDSVVGYEKTLDMRRKLEMVSNKIIPVWHPNRGIKNFYEMCEEYRGKRVAITGFGGDEIYDDQFNGFINVAHKAGCHIHILGMTRYGLLTSLNLHREDSADSTSWKQSGIFGGILMFDKDFKLQKMKFVEGLEVSYKSLITFNLLIAVKMQHILDNVDQSVFFHQ